MPAAGRTRCGRAALQLLRGPHAGGTVAVILADSGLKYLSTDLWPDDAAAPA